MPLTDVSLLVTAGNRPGYLRACLRGIIEHLSEATTVVVTDDKEYMETFKFPPKLTWERLPVGTFLTAKRNRGVELIDTKYTVMLADDFLVDANLRRVIIRMLDILDQYRLPDVIGGTFANHPFEGYLKLVPGKYIQAIPLDLTKDEPIVYSEKLKIWKVDMIPNFFMARTKVMKDVPWDESIGPIGGEHADWFLDLKTAGKTVGYTPGLNVVEQPWNQAMEAPEYAANRKRNVWIGHAAMLQKRGVKNYYGFGEEVPE